MMKKIQEVQSSGIDMFSRRFKLLPEDKDTANISSNQTFVIKLPKSKFIDITESNDIENIIVPNKKNEVTKITMKQKFGRYTIMF